MWTGEAGSLPHRFPFLGSRGQHVDYICGPKTQTQTGAHHSVLSQLLPEFSQMVTSTSGDAWTGVWLENPGVWLQFCY